MKHYSYKTQNTCSKQIDFDLDGDIVHNVKFFGGCPGNLAAIPLLIEGWKAEDVIARVGNVHCGMKSTSCSGQLCTALGLALEKQAEEANA